jgi:hypothetical protein
LLRTRNSTQNGGSGSSTAAQGDGAAVQAAQNGQAEKADFSATVIARVLDLL